MSTKIETLNSDYTFEKTFTQDLCELISTPRALTVFMMLEYGELEQLVSLDCDPANYASLPKFRDDYLVTAIMSKSPSLPLGIDRREVAVRSFMEAEASCSVVNKKFSDLTETDLPVWLFEAKRLVHDILGPLDRAALESVEAEMHHGPGATTGVKGQGMCLSEKYDKDIHLTADLIPYYKSLLGTRWWQHQRNPEVVVGSKFTTVPKSAKTDRGICIEPTLNMFVQLGIGEYMKRRLRKFGVNLKSQLRNRTMAKLAYEDGLATVDLSKASDSIAKGLVEYLLPPDWFALLKMCRSNHCVVPHGKTKKLVNLEKFSSMGNGYTFELESMIFYAVCKAIIPSERHSSISVYGDDLIIPQQDAKDVIDALEFLGFSTNHSKSFLAGDFFESCGTDWFRSQPVRPFYLKGKSEEIPYALSVCNALRIYSKRIRNDEYCDVRFKALWMKYIQLVPKLWRNCRVPEQLGDTGLIVSKSESLRHRNCEDVPGGMWTRSVKFASRKRRQGTLGYRLHVLAGIGSIGIPDEEYLRVNTHSIKTARRVQEIDVIFTDGLLPMRGLYGKIRTSETFISYWSRGLQWL